MARSARIWDLVFVGHGRRDESECMGVNHRVGWTFRFNGRHVAVASWKRKSLTASEPRTVVSEPERALSLTKLLPRALAAQREGSTLVRGVR